MKYKNITAHELVIPGVGVVAAGGEIETEVVVENPNLEPVKIFGAEDDAVETKTKKK